MVKMKNKRYYGLDIGNSAVKIIEIKKTSEGFRLGSARLMEIEGPAMGVLSGEKKDELVKSKIKQLVQEEGIAEGSIAVALSGQSVFIRPLKVPRIAKNKIEQIIQYEAQLQVPFPISEVIWNYELFDSNTGAETEVALVAVKKDIVQQKLELLSSLGLDIDFMDVDPFALYNVLDFLESVKNKIVLDMGSRVTNIIIGEDKKIWTRSILIGGNDLTSAIAQALKVDWKEAEKLKIEEGAVAVGKEDKKTSPNSQVISEAITPILVELLADISKSIGYYKSQRGESAIFRELLLTGGSANLRNMNSFVRENIDMPTRHFDLFEKVKDDLDFDVRPEYKGRFDIACGLALRTVTPLATSVNLLPKEMIRVKEFEKKKWYIFGSLAICIMMFLTLIGYLEWSAAIKNKAIKRTTSLINEYTKYQREINEKKIAINGLKQRLDYIQEFPEKRTRILNSAAHIFRLLPQESWLDNINQSEDEIILAGRAEGSFEVVSSYADRLRESDVFESVEILQADAISSEEGQDIRTFSIKLQLKK